MRSTSSEPCRTWTRLLDALMALADRQGELISHAEHPWASATFSGCRHTVTMAFSGLQAVTAGEQFVAALPDHEFTLPGQIVADAAVVDLSHQLIPQPCLTITAELLLVAES
jgi:hypothetical protein